MGINPQGPNDRTLLTGAPRSGKTEQLAQRCREACAAGTPPEHVLALTAGPQAAAAFQERLEACMSVQEAARVCVETPAGLRERLAGKHVLCEAERHFVMEDLKATGFTAAVLREALADSPEQTAGQTAGAVHAELTRLLDFLDAVMPENAMAHGDAHFDTVLVDDAQWLSRAELEALGHMAVKQVVIATSPSQGGREDAPAQWADEHGAAVVRMDAQHGSPAIARLADALCRAGGMGDAPEAREGIDPSKSITSIKWRSAPEELEGMARYLQLALRDQDEPEQQTVVAAPLRSWLRLAVKAFEQRRFSVEGCEASLGLAGDPRRSGRDASYLTYARLSLLARPEEPTSWRIWCGTGLPDLGASAWRGLMDLAQARGLNALKALASIQAEQFPGADLLAERWQAGQKLIQEKQSLRGFSLVGSLGASDVPELSEAVARLADGGARELYALVRASFEGPLPALDPHSLQVVPLDALRGASWNRVCLLGAVDGWTPKAGTADSPEQRKAFLNACSRAEQQLVISEFATASPKLAQKTGLVTTRARRVDGENVMGVKPSPFIAEAGNACPGTVGGDILLDNLARKN